MECLLTFFIGFFLGVAVVAGILLHEVEAIRKEYTAIKNEIEYRYGEVLLDDI